MWAGDRFLYVPFPVQLLSARLVLPAGSAARSDKHSRLHVRFEKISDFETQAYTVVGFDLACDVRIDPFEHTYEYFKQSEYLFYVAISAGFPFRNFCCLFLWNRESFASGLSLVYRVLASHVRVEIGRMRESRAIVLNRFAGTSDPISVKRP